MRRRSLPGAIDEQISRADHALSVPDGTGLCGSGGSDTGSVSPDLPVAAAVRTDGEIQLLDLPHCGKSSLELAPGPASAPESGESGRGSCGWLAPAVCRPAAHCGSSSFAKGAPECGPFGYCSPAGTAAACRD